MPGKSGSGSRQQQLNPRMNQFEVFSGYLCVFWFSPGGVFVMICSRGILLRWSAYLFHRIMVTRWMVIPIKVIESTHSQNPASGEVKATVTVDEISPPSGLENSQFSGDARLPASGTNSAGAVRLRTSDPLNTPMVVSVLGFRRQIITTP